MRFYRQAAVAFAALVVASLLWSACSEDSASRATGGWGDAPSGTGATAGSGGVAGAAGNAGTTGGEQGSGGEAGSPADADRPPPFPGARPCQWKGWYAPPWIPEDCTAVCVPDDPGLRVPAMRWLDASELCAGCKKLDTPWTAYGGRYVSNEISAMGPGPTHVAFTVNMEVPDPRHASPIGVVISPDGRVLHAHRTDMSVLCARAYGPVLSSDGVAAVHYRLHGETLETTRQISQVLPVSRLAELLVSADGRFTWPDTEWRGVTEFDASSRLTAVNFMGNVVVGDLQTGAHAEIDALPGALPGEYARAVVAGAAVFVRRGVAAQQDYREWWVYEQGSLRHFVGNPTEDATALGTDGKSIVWRRGRDPVGTGFDTKWTTDLYVSSFTTDEAKLVPRLLLRDVPWTFSFLVLANGWVAGTHIVPGTENERALLLVRLSDGMALRSELPEPQEWAGTPYPGETELWASVAPTPAAEYASTLVRIPYSAMQVVQIAAPAQ